jgi:hypothetical protein
MCCFIICIVAIVESLLSRESRIGGSRGVLLAMLSMAAFAFAQTIRLRSGNADPSVSALNPWNAISGDPYQTRFFAFQLLALTACLLMLYRYCATEKRINVLIHVVLGVALPVRSLGFSARRLSFNLASYYLERCLVRAMANSLTRIILLC